MSRAAEAGTSVSSLFHLTFLWRISAASLGHTYYGIFFFFWFLCLFETQLVHLEAFGSCTAEA